MGIKSGISKTEFKDVYYSMRSRCEHPNHARYKDYGGRGITVCEEWRKYPIMFVIWALKNGYEKGLTLDRIDNNKWYCPENCRWATMAVQSMNRRSSVLYEGKSVKELAKDYCINEKTLRDRLVSGLSVEEATRDKIQKGRRHEYVESIKSLAEKYGIKPSTVRVRLRMGKTLQEALTKKIQVHKNIS